MTVRLAAVPLALLASLLAAPPPAPPAAVPLSFTELHRAFAHPPGSSRIMMRWWWFGPAVTRDELHRELSAMKSGGIGGVEVQPVYPLDLDDPARGFSNLPYLSPAFLDVLRFASQDASALGLRLDLTLASGWPYGGPSVPVTEAAGRLRLEQVPVPSGVSSIPAPALSTGEKLLAVFLDDGPSLPASAVVSGRLAVAPDPARSRLALFFISSRTGMMVKRAAAGAEGFVVDHYDAAAVRHYLAAVAGTLARSFGPHPPYAVFSDSLEVMASDWTPDLLDQFRRRRGYDLTPLLPALALGRDPRSAAVRHDWGQTLTELANENYLVPVEHWARAHGVLFRSQTYGDPPVALSSNALVDLPEGEGFRWREFCESRWAASAAHLYGRPVVSSETWTWLHSPAYRATPLDMKAEADRHFLQGINQLVGHGWPYSPPSAPEPGWAFYAAAAFSSHNPWWFVMPDVAAYLQRLSFLLRQGAPVIDVALFLPTDDAWARFSPGPVSLNRSFASLLDPHVIPSILDAGYGLDFIDNDALLNTAARYPVLVLPNIERIPVPVYRRIESLVRSGVHLVFTRRAPSLAPGLPDAESQTAEIRAISGRLLASPNVRLVPEEGAALAEALHSFVPPDLIVQPAAPALGFVHRKLPSADIYFLANTSNQPANIRASFRSAGPAAQWWDPFTGVSTPADPAAPITLAPYESRVLVFSSALPSAQPPTSPPGLASLELDLSTGWRATFPDLHRSLTLSTLHSWTDDEALRYFSGRAIYEKSVTVPASFLRPGAPVRLDFGPGIPVPDPGGNAPGMRALLESPVREAARVSINGSPAGAVWHSPYSLAIAPLLRPGSNTIQIEVGNLAINALAGRALPDYRLLKRRYGDRFSPQGLANIAPLPSGLLGPVRLVSP